MLMLNCKISFLHLRLKILKFGVCQKHKDFYWINYIHNAIYVTVLFVCKMYIPWFQLVSLK